MSTAPPEQQGRGSRPQTADMFPLPQRWLHKYDDFVTKNASQVAQIESALRSLTYIIPGRFRDAEIASETIHSSVQLLSLYHDTLLARAASSLSRPPTLASPTPSPRRRPLPPPSLHARYTAFWTAKSALYRRVATALQVVQYTQLLVEMAAARRGTALRWRVVVLLEAIKAVCRLLLLRITSLRPLVTPALPERPPVPPPADEDEETDAEMLAAMMGEEDDRTGSTGSHPPNGATKPAASPSPTRPWPMPRTGLSLPTLPTPSDTPTYLLSRVLTADDIRPAARLLRRLPDTPGRAAEVLHILAPLAYAVALARARNKKAWTPWLVGLSVELAARQLRERGLRATSLERAEWDGRGWGLGWWVMRGAFYEAVTKGVVGGVRRRLPAFVGGVVEDYEGLWENYYFSTSS